MALSRKQQITHFRPMVDRAWRAHCYRECITESTPASKKDWYVQQLRKCCGVDSSKEINPKEGFEKIMAHFEEIAGDEITWQMKMLNGNSRRALHLLRETVRLLRLTDDYVAAVAGQMRFERPIRDLTSEQILKLRIALLYQCRRDQHRAIEKIHDRKLPLKETAP